MNKLLIAKSQLKVEFYDVDAMNVVWHGNYAKFLEHGRSALLSLINYNYPAMYESGYLWPVIDMRIKYIQPIRLHQEIIVTAELVEYENRMKIDYVIYDLLTNAVLSRASSIQVAVKSDQAHLELETPAIFQQKVKEASA